MPRKMLIRGLLRFFERTHAEGAAPTRSGRQSTDNFADAPVENSRDLPANRRRSHTTPQYQIWSLFEWFSPEAPISAMLPVHSVEGSDLSAMAGFRILPPGSEHFAYCLQGGSQERDTQCLHQQ